MVAHTNKDVFGPFYKSNPKSSTQLTLASLLLRGGFCGDLKKVKRKTDRRRDPISSTNSIRSRINRNGTKTNAEKCVEFNTTEWMDLSLLYEYYCPVPYRTRTVLDCERQQPEHSTVSFSAIIIVYIVY
jgi:hypothetical protein